MEAIGNFLKKVFIDAPKDFFGAIYNSIFDPVAAVERHRRAYTDIGVSASAAPATKMDNSLDNKQDTASLYANYKKMV